MLDHIYTVASRDIVFEEFDGDLVVLDLASGRYFGFNASAAAVWAAMMSGVRPADLAGIGPDTDAITAFLERLDSLGLIIAAGERGRTMGEQEKAALANHPSAPSVDVYEDLSDLIIADPIHDVEEEQGWPVMPTAS